MNNKRLDFIRLFCLGIFILPLHAHCETVSVNPDDQLPIEISSNSLNAKDKQGISIYQGNVIITQGSTKIKGEQVTLHHPNRQITTAIITGKPATFKRYLPDEQKWINGKADKITYAVKNKTLLLEGNAEIVQEGQNSISGPEIFYNLSDKTLSAKGNNAKQRIKMIFTPQTTSQEQAK